MNPKISLHELSLYEPHMIEDHLKTHQKKFKELSRDLPKQLDTTLEEKIRKAFGLKPSNQVESDREGNLIDFDKNAIHLAYYDLEKYHEYLQNQVKFVETLQSMDEASKVFANGERDASYCIDNSLTILSECSATDHIRTTLHKIDPRKIRIGRMKVINERLYSIYGVTKSIRYRLHSDEEWRGICKSSLNQFINDVVSHPQPKVYYIPQHWKTLLIAQSESRTYVTIAIEKQQEKALEALAHLSPLNIIDCYPFLGDLEAVHVPDE